MKRYIQFIHMYIQKHYLILQKDWHIVVHINHTTKQDRGTQ